LAVKLFLVATMKSGPGADGLPNTAKLVSNMSRGSSESSHWPIATSVGRFCSRSSNAAAEDPPQRQQK
jgi:hypothetical protein